MVGRSHWLSACENAFRWPLHPKHSPGRADISWKGCQNIPTQIWKFEPLLSSLQFLLQQIQPTAAKIPCLERDAKSLAKEENVLGNLHSSGEVTYPATIISTGKQNWEKQVVVSHSLSFFLSLSLSLYL